MDTRIALVTLFVSACGSVITNPAPPAHPGPSFVVTSERSALVPDVQLDASTVDGVGSLLFIAESGLEVFIDDESHGVISGGTLIVNSPALLNGEHHLRVGSTSPWEATVRLPQGIVVLERPSVVKAGKQNTITWSTQGGAPSFTLHYEVARESSLVPETIETSETTLTWTQAATSSRQNEAHFMVSAKFGDFPGWSMTSFDAVIAR